MDARRLKEIGEELQRMSEMEAHEDGPRFGPTTISALGWLASFLGICFLLYGGFCRDWNSIDIAVGFTLAGLSARFTAIFWPH